MPSTAGINCDALATTTATTQATYSSSLSGLAFVGKPDDITVDGLSYTGTNGGGSTGMTGDKSVATDGITYWENKIERDGGSNDNQCPQAMGIAENSDGS